MNSKVQKWGNSLGLRIPKALAADAGVEEGSVVELRLERGRLIVTPARGRRLPLQDLLREVRPENRHEEIDAGGPVGREAW